MNDLVDSIREEIVLCKAFYSSPVVSRVLVYLIFLVSVGVNILTLIKLFRWRKVFAVRQRAPYVAMVQVSSYLFIVLIPVLCEVLSSVGVIKWDNTPTSSAEIPFSRKTAKYLLSVSRIGVSFLTIFRYRSVTPRICVIWCQWKAHSIGNLKIFRIIRFMSYQKYALIVTISFLLFSPPLLFNWGFCITFSKPGLDWYDYDLQWAFKAKNLTIVRVLETIVSLIGLYFLRSFPQDLRIAREYTILTSLNFVTNWYYELRKPLLIYYPQQANFDCSFFNIRSEFCGDIIRSVLYTLIIAVFIRVKKVSRVPPDRIHIFQDFCFDQQCVQYFCAYLTTKHRDRLNEFSIMVNSMKSMSLKEVTFGLEDFQVEFNKFKKTVSFHTLKKLREDSNKVEKIGYVVDRR